jgi:hypothetical protein
MLTAVRTWEFVSYCCVHEACCRLLMWSTVGSVVWEQGHCIKTAQQQALPTGQHAQVLHALQHLSRQHYL